MPRVDYTKFTGLSPKQQAWIKAYFDSENPASFMSLTGAARAAGYRATSNKSFGNIGSENLKKLGKFIRARLDKLSLSDVVLDSLMIRGMKAMGTKFFVHKGKIVAQVDVIDWSARRAFLDMANKIRGRYAPEKHEHDIKAKNEKLSRIPIDVLRKIVTAHSEKSGKEKKPVK